MKPIKLPDVVVVVDAPQNMTYEVLGAFGAKTFDGSVNKILKRNGEELLISFVTPVKIGPAKIKMKTVEIVRKTPDSKITFDLQPAKGIAGFICFSHETFEFEAIEKYKTKLTYSNQIAVRGGWISRLFVLPVVKRMYVSFMNKHIIELRDAVEYRAVRSYILKRDKECDVKK